MIGSRLISLTQPAAEFNPPTLQAAGGRLDAHFGQVRGDELGDIVI